MNTVDIVILLFIAVGGWHCWRSGFTRSIWGLVAICAGVFAASQFWRDLSPIVEQLIDNPEIAKWVSIVGIAAGVSMAIDWLMVRVQWILEKGILGWINGLIGALFGILASVILIGGICIMLTKHGSESIQRTFQQSQLTPSTMDFAHQFFDFGKETLQQQVDKIRQIPNQTPEP